MREGNWTPCARSASVWVARASGRSQPLLDRIGLGWVPELEAPLMPDHFQGEYVISKQSLNSPHPEPAFPQPQSCLASHSGGYCCWLLRPSAWLSQGPARIQTSWPLMTGREWSFNLGSGRRYLPLCGSAIAFKIPGIIILPYRKGYSVPWLI